MADLDDIITRTYTNFMGVDYRGGEVPYYHSPDALNMWRDYGDSDCIQTRPAFKYIGHANGELNAYFQYTNPVTGAILYFLHIQTKIYKNSSLDEDVEPIYTGVVNTSNSFFFMYEDNVYFMDGANYLKWDSSTDTIAEVDGTVPTTSYYMNPDGSTDLDLSSTDTDYIYQNVNCLTPKRRNRFIADGEAVTYRLDAYGLDNQPVRVEIENTQNGTHTELIENTDYSVNREEGYIVFNVAPTKDYYVFVLFYKTVSGLRDRILGCKKMAEFDNRIFLTGNPDYPQAIFWCSENDPEYFAEDDKLEVGLNLAQINALVPGNNVLWVFKEKLQNTTSVYYLTPTINSTSGKYYSPVSGNINEGCIGSAVNFNDDIVFLTERGLDAISSSSMYSEQIVAHRSTYVDAKLLNEDNYADAKMFDCDGYLYIYFPNSKHVYVADSRKKVSTGSGDTEYEWFYWETEFDIRKMFEYKHNIYIFSQIVTSISDAPILVLDGEEECCLATDTTESKYSTKDVASYWTTRADNFGYASYTKTTNKKGCALNLKTFDNDEISITAIPDKKEKHTKVISDAKGYAVVKMKEKKFYKLQYKISSPKKFGIYSLVVQGFVAGYVKR